MLTILNVKITGFRLLEDSFELDLSPKARVYEKDLEKEVYEPAPGLFAFHSIAFVGGNSSGKSTVLALLYKSLVLLQTGRWGYDPFDFRGEDMKLSIMFYLEGKLFSYSCRLLKPSEPSSSYCPIEDEALFHARYDRVRGKKNIALFDSEKEDGGIIFEYSLFDTSAITKITQGKASVDAFYSNSAFTFQDAVVRNSFYLSLGCLDEGLVSSLVGLLDESIEKLSPDGEGGFLFKRCGEAEVSLKLGELTRVLSAGTFRGVELYIRAIKALKEGRVLIVDEIESCFHKNLVYNLLFLFNDSSLNRKGASLLFSTHYVEILDYLSRRDDVFITHKEKGRVLISNLYADYDVRTELLKSRQFDNNVFNTSLNYERLLKVKKGIADELDPANG